ncbi:hypothetical protein TNCV_3215691 [Trichonephila clavipes]|nr:hypothetical protein TNCV_3215691 [Trichonephila clavipes]
MSKYLPLKDFVWSDNDLTEQDILNLSDESDVAVEKNNSSRPLNSKIKANAGEKQLNSSVGTKQLNSTGENNSTRQHERNNSTGENNSTQKQERNNSTLHCRRPPAIAYNRLHRLYSRIGNFYLLTYI